MSSRSSRPAKRRSLWCCITVVSDSDLADDVDSDKMSDCRTLDDATDLQAMEALAQSEGLFGSFDELSTVEVPVVSRATSLRPNGFPSRRRERYRGGHI